MTENNAAQPGELLLDYAMHIAHERELDVTGHKHDSDGAVRRFKAAVDRALLSKLRAEGVQAGDQREAFEAWANNDTPESASLPLSRNSLGDYEDERADGAWHGWNAHARRAALASAPVAGEAQAVPWEEVRDALAMFLSGATGKASKHWIEPLEDATASGPLAKMRARLAAPQASEAVAWTNDTGDIAPISDALKQARPDLYGKHYTRPLVYAAPQTRDADAPTEADAEEMGREGAPHSEAERKLYEAYCRGHCWAVGPWLADKGSYHEMIDRIRFAMWRDRAALAAAQGQPGGAHGGS